MADFLLRPMTESDVDAVMEIENSCFSVPWSRSEMVRECSNENAFYLVAEKGGKAAGYGGFWQIIDEAHITNIAVSADYRRQGIGEKIVRGLMGAAKEAGDVAITLEVRKSNAAARHLYEKCGFRLEGIRPGYYSDKEDACIYWAREL